MHRSFIRRATSSCTIRKMSFPKHIENVKCTNSMKMHLSCNKSSLGMYQSIVQCTNSYSTQPVVLHVSKRSVGSKNDYSADELSDNKSTINVNKSDHKDNKQQCKGRAPNNYTNINGPDIEEELEIEKDKAALRKMIKWGSVVFLCVVTLYFGAKRARRRYFGKEGSAFVHVESRGKPALGGPFVLVNTRTGKPVSQASFLGKWTFFYFGFTHCPEICPVELNRMTHVVNVVKEKKPNDEFVPLFVSCDPNRDSLEAIEEYLSVFHPDFIGLVGTPQQVHQTCKNYRIYYSVPTEEDTQTDDYLIDHSIAIFLFDPQGRFVDFFGNRYDEHEIADKVLHYMDCYDADHSWTNW